MGSWNLGSVADTVLDIVENVPSAISGTRLLEMADRQRQFCESYTGQSIGSTGISLTYQGALVDLTIAEVLSLMNTIGVDATSIRIGDFSESRGGQSNVMLTSQDFKNRGMQKLGVIGRRVDFYKSLG